MIDERTRHEMYLGLEQKLGPIVADALMQHLPPVGWAEVANKHDLAALEERMDLRFRLVDTRFEALLEVLDARFAQVDRRFDAVEARMDAKIEASQRHMIQWTVGTMIALTTVFTAVGAITQLH